MVQGRTGRRRRRPSPRPTRRPPSPPALLPSRPHHAASTWRRVSSSPVPTVPASPDSPTRAPAPPIRMTVPGPSRWEEPRGYRAHFLPRRERVTPYSPWPHPPHSPPEEASGVTTSENFRRIVSIVRSLILPGTRTRRCRRSDDHDHHDHHHDHHGGGGHHGSRQSFWFGPSRGRTLAWGRTGGRGWVGGRRRGRGVGATPGGP